MRDAIDHKLWRDSFIAELEYYKDYLSDKEIISIFFGGGTPSLAHESVIAGVIERISSMGLNGDAEITMEANPTSVEASKFEALSKAGVNRVSLGIQSLRDKNLKFLGREHDVAEARGAIELARKNFNRYSFDLIYALPNQTLPEWEVELDEAIAMAGGHLSLYQLTIEKGTHFFGAHRAGEFVMPDNELAADMYTRTEEVLEGYGYKAYEVSNYAKPGHECLHNMQYWRYGNYLGIGPGAHGRIEEGGKRYATQNISSPESWLKLIADRGVGIQRKDLLKASDIASERIMMGLRTLEGVEITDDVNEIRLQELVDNELLYISGSKMVATKQGRLLLNSVIGYLI